MRSTYLPYPHAQNKTKNLLLKDSDSIVPMSYACGPPCFHGEAQRPTNRPHSPQITITITPYPMTPKRKRQTKDTTFTLNTQPREQSQTRGSTPHLHQRCRGVVPGDRTGKHTARHAQDQRDLSHTKLTQLPYKQKTRGRGRNI